MLVTMHLGCVDQKDSCSDMYKAGYAGCDVPCAVFFSLVRRPMMLGIMAGLTQVNRGLEEYMENWVYWEMTSYVSVFSSLVRQWIQFYVSLQRPGFLHPLVTGSQLYGVRCSPLEYRLWNILGDYFWNGFRMQRSLVGQWIHVWRQSTRPFGRFSHVWTLVFQRNAWFDSGFMLMRQTMEAPVWKQLWQWHVQDWFALFVDISVVVQRQIPMVLFRKDILQLQYTDKVINVLCAGPALECRRGGASRAPTVAAR